MSDATVSPLEEAAQLVQDQKRLYGLFHRLLDTDDGQEFLRWLSVRCLERERTFVPGQADMTAFNEGKRVILLMIRRILNADVDGYEKAVMAEARKRRPSKG